MQLASDATSRESPSGADAEFDPLESAEGGPGEALRPYHWLHASYAAVVIVLVVTGLPIQFPDLRAKVLGGYGSWLATIHEWAGVVMLVLPLTAVLSGAPTVMETLRVRSYRREYLRFHAFNLWFTLSSGAIFVASGFVLWFQTSLPDLLADISLELHIYLSYALYLIIPLHVFVAWRRIVEATLRWWTRGRTSPRRLGVSIAAKAKGRI